MVGPVARALLLAVAVASGEWMFAEQDTDLTWLLQKDYAMQRIERPDKAPATDVTSFLVSVGADGVHGGVEVVDDQVETYHEEISANATLPVVAGVSASANVPANLNGVQVFTNARALGLLVEKVEHEATEKWIPAFVLSAPTMGLLLGGLYAFTPDHLAMLFTITAGVRPNKAFGLGLYWGSGHSFGMMLVFLAFTALNRVIDIEVWELYGNYCAGCLLILMGAYFVIRENHYLEERSDGSVESRPCSCCLPFTSAAQAGLHGAVETSQDGWPVDSDALVCGVCESDAPPGRGAAPGKFQDLARSRSPFTPALSSADGRHNEPTSSSSSTSYRHVQSAAVGVLQGLCCPSCVASFGLVGTVAAAKRSLADTLSFMVVYTLTTALVNGALAMAWSSATASVGSSCISARGAYRCCCAITILVGIVWIAVNASGYMHLIDYGDSLALRFNSLADQDLHHQHQHHQA